MLGRAGIAVVLFGALCFAPDTRAQPVERASPDVINAEARYLELPGPREGGTRAIYIWRAPSTPGNQVLPTLYMADGAPGLYVAAARLRPAIEAGVIPAVQIIGLAPDTDRRNRTSEYIDRGRERFRLHERWVLDVVIPWAEQHARADPARRAVGGYSNGAAFAIFMGGAHPDIFTAVLAHSPIATAETFHADAGVGHMRWVLSAGRSEYGGYPAGAISLVGAAVRGNGGEVRLCRGTWGHEASAWIDLSPGSIAWLFRFEQADRVATALEREACEAG